MQVMEIDKKVLSTMVNQIVASNLTVAAVILGNSGADTKTQFEIPTHLYLQFWSGLEDAMDEVCQQNEELETSSEE